MSYNIAPGYIEPVYRAVSDTQLSSEGGSGGTGGEAHDDASGDGSSGGSEGITPGSGGSGGSSTKYVLQPMKWGKPSYRSHPAHLSLEGIPL